MDPQWLREERRCGRRGRTEDLPCAGGLTETKSMSIEVRGFSIDEVHVEPLLELLTAELRFRYSVWVAETTLMSTIRICFQ